MPAEAIAKSDYSVHEHARQVIAERNRQHTQPRGLKLDVEPLTLEQHVARAATYEWKCTDCGATALSSAEGGNLDFGDCECDHIDGHNLEIWIIFSGQRTFMATSAAIEGRKPGEPSKARLHLELCTDAACQDFAHRWRSLR